MSMFGERIKLLRLTKGFTQAVLAQRLRMSLPVIHTWEYGGLPRAAVIPRLADILGVDPTELAELYMADILIRKEGK